MAFGFSDAKKLMQMQREARKVQNEMKALIVQASSNNGFVTVQINGNQEVLEIEIDDELLDPDRKKELVKAIKEAFKNAQKKLQKELMKGMDMDRLKGMMG
jgi:hypothetical protein